jgi:hypothetical protein
MVSAGGGDGAHWRGDGKELFSIHSDNTVMAVDVSTSPAFKAGVPKALFKGPFGGSFYEVSSDRKRFPDAHARRDRRRRAALVHCVAELDVNSESLSRLRPRFKTSCIHGPRSGRLVGFAAARVRGRTRRGSEIGHRNSI